MSPERKGLVAVERCSGIALVWIDNPPVNALSAVLRNALAEAINAVAADAAVQGIVLACRGRTFVAGADITEVGTALQTQPPILPDLCEMLETLPVPTAAAIHGTALGGGLELALACSFRVMERAARVGLPEVKLGFIPGAGGTVRLPRLVGPVKALSMIASGEAIDAETALQHGLADLVVDGSPARAAAAHLLEQARSGVRPPAVRERDAKLLPVRFDPADFDKLAVSLLAKARYKAPVAAAVDAVRAAFTLEFDEALAMERGTFLTLSKSSEASALRHLFLAEREARKVAGLDATVQPREISRVGVVGAGTMGGGIAMAFSNAGLPVTLVEADASALAQGMAAIGSSFAGSISRGSLSEGERAQRLSRIAGTLDFASLAECDLVVEAVFEDMALKIDLFRRLGAIAKPGAVLATNTSYLDVDRIAAASGRPADVVGLHFFSPAHVMKLLEVVRGQATSADVIATAQDVARRIGKVAVVVRNSPGFVGNRMLAARNAENENLLLEGASPADIDRAFREFGWSMGPFQMADLAGLDISWRNRKASGRTAVIADALCEMGRFGQKTGAGYYRYEEGSRQPIPDPEVQNLIERKAKDLSVRRGGVTSLEIIRRTHTPLVSEGLRILEDGVAARSGDIDVIWVHGYGFPAEKGGPMFWSKGHCGGFDS